MCVQAAYVGKGSGAPILLKMLEKTEGLWAGFYTGIATIANGKLYHDKVVGNLSILREKTGAEKFPGTIGIAHSRTPGKGNREWGHPFLDCSDNLALCEQGSPGIFRGEFEPNVARIVARLIKEGHRFRSATKVKLDTESATIAPSGENIHTSEVICHEVGSHFKKSGDMLKAMGNTLNEVRGECCGIAIELTYPKQIFMANLNQSLAIGWDERGAYVASSALAFPDTVKRSFRLPAGSAAAINPVDLKIVNLPEWKNVIENPFTSAEVEKSVLEFLRKNPGKSVPEIYSLCVKKLYPETTLNLCHQTTLEVIEQLLKTEKIVYRTEQVPGTEEGLTAPKMVFDIAI